MRPNTVLLSWFDRKSDEPGGGNDSEPGLPSFGRYLRMSLSEGCNLVVLEATEQEMAALEATAPKERQIDVWYQDDATGHLMLLFAYLITRNEQWKRARIRLFVPASGGASAEQLAALRTMLEEVRIEAEPEVVEDPGARAIVRHSATATLVFLPFRLREGELRGPFDVHLEELVGVLPVTAMVLAARDIVLDAAPEEGRHAAIASAKDSADKALRVAKEAEREAVRAAELSARTRREAAHARERAAGDEQVAALEQEAERARTEAERLARRAAKARGKAEIAEREARSLVGEAEGAPSEVPGSSGA